MTDKLATVKVDTLAKPLPGSLLAARTAIRVRPDLQELFDKAKAEKWTAEQLADALYVTLPHYIIETEGLWETALYLADEFLQFGASGGFLIVSRETGQAILQASEEDIYLPEPVKRESGRLRQPLPRLRPDLEGAIVQWEFEKGRDERILQTLAKRASQTDFLAQEGDNRLLRATRKGRKEIVDMLRGELPTLLPPDVGLVREFLELFHFCTPTEVPEDFEACGEAMVRAVIVMPIVDPLASNLRHDPYTLLKRQVVSQWTRDIAQLLTNSVQYNRELEASVLDALPAGFWLADPNVAMALGGKRVLPLPAWPITKTILLHDWLAPVACLCIKPDSYECQSREFLERWEVAAVCKLALYVKPDSFSVYSFRDVPVSGVSAELVL
jgi:hypothetical protein